MCGLDPRPTTAIFLPFKSLSERTRSVPNSSKHPRVNSGQDHDGILRVQANEERPALNAVSKWTSP